MADDGGVGEQEERLGDEREEGGTGEPQHLPGIPLVVTSHEVPFCRAGTPDPDSPKPPAGPADLITMVQR